jgi:hypothetical protein
VDTTTLLLIFLVVACIVAIPFVVRKRSVSGLRLPRERAEPPYTTKDGITAPKFGSAGSGGAEYEPGPEQVQGRRDGR